MEWEIIYVFGVLIAAIALFISDKIRLDLVAVLVILALVLSGILSAKEGFSGFGATVVLLIAGLFVVGEGLAQTGVSYAIGDKIVKIAGKGEIKLIALLMISAAFLSAFMSSTGAVAIFVPVAVRLAVRSDLPPSRFLMPLAFGALIGGMLTLIGTPPNLVVSDQMEKAGYGPFGFFDFTVIGFPILLLGLAYFALFGRKLLGKKGVVQRDYQGNRAIDSFIKNYGIENKFVCFKVEGGSFLSGKTVVEAQLRSRLGFTAFGVKQASAPPKQGMISTRREIPFAEGDLIYGVMVEDEINQKKVEELGIVQQDVAEDDYHMSARELGLAELIIPAQSKLVGNTIFGSRFRSLYNLATIAIMHHGEPVRGNFSEVELEFGDQLLVAGDWQDIAALRQERKNFLVVSLPEEFKDLVAKPHLSWAAIAIVALMLVLIVGNFVSTVVAVTLAAILMAVSGCVSGNKIYSCMNWQSLVLIAGMLPMATALEKTGGLKLIVDSLMDFSGGSHPTLMLVSLFLITSLFSQVISNTATSVLIAPVAIGAAEMMGVSPMPFLIAVAVAASTSFSTPVASPVNMLVLGPGGYRFKDFVTVGLPLQVLTLLLATILIPLLFPYH